MLGCRVDVGAIDLTIVSSVSPWNAVPLFWRLFGGTLGRTPTVWRQTAARFVVEGVATGLLHTDGETHACGTRVEFSIRPESLRIMVPAIR